MIALNNPNLTPYAQGRLAVYQARVDAGADFDAKVKLAKDIFPTANVKGNKTFDEIKRHLNDMCCGPERCNYCEDSKADEVEHIKPKDWYPEQCFIWENYCYSCGTCNGPKNNKFAVIVANGDLVNLVIDKNAPSRTAPVAGASALISPRTENPMQFLFLDLISSTFFFIPFNSDKTHNDYKRADFTVNVLGLNSRSYLVKSRKLAFTGFRARLSEYVAQKQAGAPQNELDEMIQNLKEDHHQTVWQEMKRQHTQIPELAALFLLAPEALAW